MKGSAVPKGSLRSETARKALTNFYVDFVPERQSGHHLSHISSLEKSDVITT